MDLPICASKADFRFYFATCLMQFNGNRIDCCHANLIPGLPTLMDYPGLTKYSDMGDISRFAQPAMAWAHQKGLVPAEGRLGPRDTVTSTEAEQMMRALSK